MLRRTCLHFGAYTVLLLMAALCTGQTVYFPEQALGENATETKFKIDWYSKFLGTIANPLTSRDRIIAAVFVLAAVAAQSYWLGRGVMLLSLGLIITYPVWALAPWKNEPARVLPTYLLAIAVQCVHFTEEFVTGFQRQFPNLLGSEWSDAQFVAFNMAWLAVFVLAALGVYRRVRLAYLVVLFLALIGGIGNGTSHLLLSATQGRYFPGLVTAPLCLLVGIAVLSRLFGQTKEHVN